MNAPAMCIYVQNESNNVGTRFYKKIAANKLAPTRAKTPWLLAAAPPWKTMGGEVVGPTGMPVPDVIIVPLVGVGGKPVEYADPVVRRIIFEVG